MLVLTILSLLLGVGYFSGGLAKLIGIPVMRADAQRFGFAYRSYRLIGVAELSGGAGLAVAPWVTPLGIAAAAGLVLLMCGAVITHIRVQDPPSKTMPAGIFGLVVLTTGLLHAFS